MPEATFQCRCLQTQPPAGVQSEGENAAASPLPAEEMRPMNEKESLLFDLFGCTPRDASEPRRARTNSLIRAAQVVARSGGDDNCSTTAAAGGIVLIRNWPLYS